MSWKIWKISTFCKLFSRYPGSKKSPNIIRHNSKNKLLNAVSGDKKTAGDWPRLKGPTMKSMLLGKTFLIQWNWKITFEDLVIRQKQWYYLHGVKTSAGKGLSQSNEISQKHCTLKWRLELKKLLSTRRFAAKNGAKPCCIMSQRKSQKHLSWLQRRAASSFVVQITLEIKKTWIFE